ncbi:protein-methionine-sulfoxide reductase heme-binding subunit MsrQ [Sabulicella rubraurantiaca]|uniref:sulfite oxidase heme-binding subunit YedZ n=1 Tax=Sabulicella rubraurantiaca TaxID=2811429 RepID=UPI001A9795BF|nr:protein-methionine-sulfoxide reductase heme-binding subunit MsrQ [Sabulicella rubraurantiaca]
MAPWRDRAGRVSPLRIATLLALVLPAGWILYLALSHGLGPEPLNQAMHETGRWALRFLVITLAVTPLGRALSWPRLFTIRRMLGLGTLAWAVLHLSLYVADQNWVIWRAALEIASRFYLALGFTALLGLTVLGWTSTDGWMKRLGRRWKKLHKLVFPIATIALLHAFIQSKADTSQPVLMAGLFLWLVAWRFLPARWQAHPAALLCLVLLAVGGAAGLEYAWYALTTNLPAARIAAANLDLSFGPRPAVQAGLVALAIPLLVLLRRLAGGPRAA